MAWGFAGVAVASLAILAAPLAAYVALIAIFGLPHVLYEMRYVDERFAGRIGGRVLGLIGVLLTGVAFARIGRWIEAIPADWAVWLELGFGAALAFAALTTMRRRRGVAALAATALMAGIFAAPIPTLLAIAWLHNLTPLAFAAELAPAGERRRVLAWLALPFLVWPAIIASGAPLALLRMGLAIDPAGAPSLFGAGERPLSAFLPAGLDLDSSASLFAAAVTAQAMHYFAVIVMLPRMLRTRGGTAAGPTVAPWPSWGLFAMGIAVTGLITLAVYAASFNFARGAYGVAAALHSWVELPILLIALGQAGTARPLGGAVERS